MYLTNDMSLMLFKWNTELAFIRAKFLAKCILERAVFSAEKQDGNNIDGITLEVRPPLPHQLYVFAAHWVWRLRAAAVSGTCITATLRYKGLRYSEFRACF